MQVLARRHRRGNLYALEEKNEAVLSAIRGKATDSSVWHKRHRHPNFKVLHVLKTQRKIDISQWTKEPNICVS